MISSIVLFLRRGNCDVGPLVDAPNWLTPAPVVFVVVVGAAGFLVSLSVVVATEPVGLVPNRPPDVGAAVVLDGADVLAGLAPNRLPEAGAVVVAAVVVVADVVAAGAEVVAVSAGLAAPNSPPTAGVEVVADCVGLAPPKRLPEAGADEDVAGAAPGAACPTPPNNDPSVGALVVVFDAAVAAAEDVDGFAPNKPLAVDGADMPELEVAVVPAVPGALLNSPPEGVAADVDCAAGLAPKILEDPCVAVWPVTGVL